eukprot:2015662-Prymnesium_polylepis.1
MAAALHETGWTQGLKGLALREAQHDYFMSRLFRVVLRVVNYLQAVRPQCIRSHKVMGLHVQPGALLCTDGTLVLELTERLHGVFVCVQAAVVRRVATRRVESAEGSLEQEAGQKRLRLLGRANCEGAPHIDGDARSRRGVEPHCGDVPRARAVSDLDPRIVGDRFWPPLGMNPKGVSRRSNLILAVVERLPRRQRVDRTTTNERQFGEQVVRQQREPHHSQCGDIDPTGRSQELDAVVAL